MSFLVSRSALAAGFALFGALFLGSAHAASPASGTLTNTSGVLTYTSGPFLVSNPSGTAGDVDCSNFPCDDYKLTVTLPAGFMAANPTAKFKVSTAWSVTAEDYDIYLLSSTGGSLASSASSNDPEEMTVTPVDGTTQYTIRIVPFTAAGGSPTTTISLIVPPPGKAPAPQLAATGVAPRYYLYPSPPANGNSAGEPSIGYNWKTGNGMFLASLETLRVAFPGLTKDTIDPAMAGLPGNCDATWTDVSYVTTSATTLDPILWTDSKSGRTFVSQLTGANSLFAYTDDDGSNWMPGQIGPPDGGPDHQTVGTGPYPAGSPFGQAAAAAGFNYAVYYCSQGNAAAYCARSDDGGLTFANGNPIYILEKDCGTPLGAIHGHVKVSPVDGAAYVAPKDCGGLQGVTVSKDAGVTWTMKTLPNTDADSEIDPAVAVDGGNRLYDCHIRQDGHVHVQTSDNQGDTWANDYDIGASQNVVMADFPEMVAGDKNRAACAFIGTTTPGNHDAVDFPGIWYGYVATTYDGGQSWHTVLVTPGDPVQGAGGVCNAGTLTCGTNRNLLDFNEITMDEKGYPLFGFADGCIGACVQDPKTKNGFANKATIVRQVGGRPLIAKNDPTGAETPLAACLAGNRVVGKSSLTWRAPDNGGSTIANYTIYRAVAPTGPFTKVGTSAKALFDDTTVDDSVSNYYYRVTATNTTGEGKLSNFVKLPITAPVVAETSCKLPGITTSFGDNTVQITGGMAPDDTQNLLSMSIAELPTLADKLVFTIKVLGTGSPAAQTQWLGIFSLADGSQHFVEMTTETGSPTFMYGDVAVVNANATSVTTYTTAGSIDAASSYSKGVIQLVVPRNTFGAGKLAKGQVLTNVLARSRIVTSGQTGSVGRLVDELSSGSYTIAGTDICAINTAPLAVLTADVQKGAAPLAVKFGVFGSDADTGDTLASYSLDFGDGSPAVTDKAFSAQSVQTVSHSYAQAGNYAAKLTVKDSRGLISSNVAGKTIEVLGTVTGGSSTDCNSLTFTTGHSTNQACTSGGRFGGGAFGAPLLGLMGLGALLRRRRRQ